jgi:two-component system CheB/CheR fusion protein
LHLEKERVVGRETLMEMFIPPTLIFNNKLQVIYNYGDTSLFTTKIKPGQVSNDISNILNQKLISSALTAAHQVVRQKKSILMKNVFQSTQDDGSITNWSLKAYSFRESNMADDLVAISFLEESDPVIEKKADITYTEDEQSKKRLEELDESLIECQKLYREVVEELDSTSEELQSSNEELMAANEELQSTNEELQSVNEELYTVNSEYQQKILELTNVNNDLQNLIKTTRMAVVFLDADNKIRRYTEAVRDFVNIIDFDIDRDFRDLSLPESFKGLHDTIDKVNQSGKVAVEVYESKKGEKIKVNIHPYMPGFTHKGVVISMGKSYGQE